MAYKLIDISAAAISSGGLYHLEGREDGQTCVLEGDVEGEGRLVDCFNTVEDAESYLSTLVEEVIEYAAEEVAPEENVENLQDMEEEVTLSARWAENVVPIFNVATAVISSTDEGISQDGFVVSATTNDAAMELDSPTSSAPTAGSSYLRVGDSVMKSDATIAKLSEIRNSSKSSALIEREPVRTSMSELPNSPSVNDLTTTLATTPIETRSPESGGKTSKSSLSDKTIAALSVDAISNSYQVQVQGGMPTSTIAIPRRKSGDGSARRATEDLEPSMTTSNSSAEQSITFKNRDTNSFSDLSTVLRDGGSLVAAAGQLPPLEFFGDPEFDSLQRYVTITSDGRFMTHLASWETCHVGYANACVLAPREGDYSHFAVGQVLTSTGELVPTGVIALKGGHADINLSATSARAHYDDPTTAKVDVAVGTDDFGIWLSGALRAGATEQDIHDLRASGVSGDWRMIDGELRLIGICSVNVPGFPKLAIAASADGHMEALVAAGGPPLPHPSLCGCNDADEIESLKKLVADAGITDVAIEKLSSRIPASEEELDELYNRVDA